MSSDDLQDFQPKFKEELLQCNIESFTYNFYDKLAVLCLPLHNCPDMNGAIAFCKLINKEVRQIQVYEADILINVYYKQGHKWLAKSLPRYKAIQ
jgi:hypothetical protein